MPALMSASIAFVSRSILCYVLFCQLVNAGKPDPDVVDPGNEAEFSQFHDDFVVEFGRNFANENEKQRSKAALKAWLIAYKRPKTYTTRLSDDADKTPEQLQAKLGQLSGLPEPDKRDMAPAIAGRFTRFARQAPPAAVDYRGTGYVTSVKDQGACGSCYAFAAIAGLEGQYYKKIGRLATPPKPAEDLSPDQMIDCTLNPPLPGGTFAANFGCDGGWTWKIYEYMRTTGNKAMKDPSYPYSPYNAVINSACGYTGSLAKSKYLIKTLGGSGTWFLTQNEATLESYVNSIGPIVVTFNAYTDFFTYASGVLSIPGCDNTVNHAVLVVGYNNTATPPYWIIKNSWGTGWGESGYFRLEKNAVGVGYEYGMCGVAYIPHYPNVVS